MHQKRSYKPLQNTHTHTERQYSGEISVRQHNVLAYCYFPIRNSYFFHPSLHLTVHADIVLHRGIHTWKNHLYSKMTALYSSSTISESASRASGKSTFIDHISLNPQEWTAVTDRLAFCWVISELRWLYMDHYGAVTICYDVIDRRAGAHYNLCDGFYT